MPTETPTAANPFVPRDELVRLPSSIRAWKAARLGLESTGQGVFVGATAQGVYGACDLAQCRKSGHVPPELGCRCGFYAWRDRDPAVAYLRWGVPALLEVELFGRFDEYELGYVSAGQIVTRIEVLPVCIHCSRDGRQRGAVGLSYPGSGRAGRYFGVRPRRMESTCGLHVGELVDVDEVAERFGVAARWLVDPAAITRIASRQQTMRQLRDGRERRSVADLRGGETAAVRPSAMATDAPRARSGSSYHQERLWAEDPADREGERGRLWIDPRAPLVRPLPSLTVALRRRAGRSLEVDLTGTDSVRRRWTRRNPERHTVPVTVVGDFTR